MANLGSFIFFQMRSHHSLYQDIFTTAEERQYHHRERLTIIEAGVAVTIAITCVTFMALYLVEGIPYIVEKRGIKDA
jgi:Ca2+:H+ antiporter